MKRVLIYGDSNLWGYNHNKRFEEKYRWSYMLSEYLKDDYEFIAEGLPGRIAGNMRKDEPYKNGLDSFRAIFESCAPVDYVIIALGTNDLQTKYQRTAEEIYNDLMKYQKIVNDDYDIPKYYERFFNNKMPEFIYIMPGNFDYILVSNKFDISREQERIKLIEMFKSSNNKYVEIKNIDLEENDGVHFSKKGHQMIFDEIKKLFD